MPQVRPDERISTALALPIVATAALCLVGAFWLPFLHSEFTLDLPGWMPRPLGIRVREWLVLKGRIPVGDQYLWDVISRLFVAREYLVGWAILMFSVVFPTLKIALCAALASGSGLFAERSRQRLIHGLAVVGKWSMADVFIVGMIIVFFKAQGFHFSFAARPGVYCYAAAAVLSSLAVSVVRRLHEARLRGRGQRLAMLAMELDRLSCTSEPVLATALRRAADRLRAEVAGVEGARPFDSSCYDSSGVTAPAPQRDSR